MVKEHSQYARHIELGGPHPSTVISKRLSEASALLFHHTTPSGWRTPTRRGTVRAQRLSALLYVRGLSASIGSVERHLVRRREVDLLDNINLTANRPVWALCPDRRPYGAPERHMHSVDDEDGPYGEESARLHADRVALVHIGDRSCVVESDNCMAGVVHVCKVFPWVCGVWQPIDMPCGTVTRRVA